MLTITCMTACSSTSKPDTARFCDGYTQAAKVGSDLSAPRELGVAEFRRRVDATDQHVTKALEFAPASVKSNVEALATPLRALRDAVDHAKDQSEIDLSITTYSAAAAKLSAPRSAVNTWTLANCHVAVATTTTAMPLGGITSSGSTIP